ELPADDPRVQPGWDIAAHHAHARLVLGRVRPKVVPEAAVMDNDGTGGRFHGNQVSVMSVWTRQARRMMAEGQVKGGAHVPRQVIQYPGDGQDEANVRHGQAAARKAVDRHSDVNGSGLGAWLSPARPHLRHL